MGSRDGVAGRLTASVRGWATGRNWWIRARVLLWMGWILVRYWSAPTNNYFLGPPVPGGLRRLAPPGGA